MTSQLMVESRNDRAENAWGLGWGNLSFGSVKGSKGQTDEFYGFIKSRKRPIFVTKTKHLQQLKGMKSCKEGM